MADEVETSRKQSDQDASAAEGGDVQDDVVSEIENESDRGAVLVALAHLDGLIAELIEAKFEVGSAQYIAALDLNEYELDLVALSKLQAGTRKKLLKYPGPLSSSAAKLDLAFSLGWLSEDSYHDVTQIRKLRNKAAHTTDPVHLFEDQGIRTMLSSLRLSGDVARVAASEPNAYRQGFTLAVIMISQDIFAAIEQTFEERVLARDRTMANAQSAIKNFDQVIEQLRRISGATKAKDPNKENIGS